MPDTRRPDNSSQMIQARQDGLTILGFTGVVLLYVQLLETAVGLRMVNVRLANHTSRHGTLQRALTPFNRSATKDSRIGGLKLKRLEVARWPGQFHGKPRGSGHDGVATVRPGIPTCPDWARYRDEPEGLWVAPLGTARARFYHPGAVSPFADVSNPVRLALVQTSSTDSYNHPFGRRAERTVGWSRIHHRVSELASRGGDDQPHNCVHVVIVARSLGILSIGLVYVILIIVKRMGGMGRHDCCVCQQEATLEI
ncbi:uncharacterized protein ATNIH1004_009019 [Aspergillus tanneri]|uniref:Uncharacterized protein n=1 Tax=Aspergillus tanneri TaxID=1220188 RepID=A0A5M9MCZ8_9EURO|nr:uncharacterized protein ATNIH1004_009019 [Aspergillus tanneri]KAA8644811.1 hypothetical protein ATNIH1004_009019 [Aspergillus tanneri]